MLIGSQSFFCSRMRLGLPSSSRMPLVSTSWSPMRAPLSKKLCRFGPKSRLPSSKPNQSYCEP